jgi:hypothetical protein
MLMTGVPLEHALQSMVCLNHLKNCPITHDDVKIAHTIYGHDLTNIRGKTVRRKPEHVEENYIEIPKELLSLHQNVALVADVMFVNSVPFLVLASRNINLITIQHTPKQTASKLGYLLQHIVNVYAKAGFNIRMILVMDNEFEKIRDRDVTTVDMNTPAAAEHIAEVERRIL